MPRGRAGHLRRMVGNDDAVEGVAVENLEHAEYIHVAIVDESLPVAGHPAGDVAEMDVADPSLAAVLVDDVVDVIPSLRDHLGERADAKFERVGLARVEIDEFLVQARPVDQARLATHGRRGGIVRMQGQFHAGFLGHRQDLTQKLLQAAPQFGGVDRRLGARGSGGIVNHVPDHAARHGKFERPLHSHRRRAAAGIRARGATGDPGEAEIITHDRDARLPKPPDDGLQVLHLRGFFRAGEQHVVPVGWIEILDGLEGEACSFDLAPQGDEFVEGPEPVGVAGQAPAAIGAGGLIVVHAMSPVSKIIHEMRHDVRGSGLARELEMLAREHVAIEAEAELHGVKG